MSRVRIVHLVEALGRGGLERVVAALVRHADRARYDVEVLCAVARGPVAEEIESESGVTVGLAGVRGYRLRDVGRVAAILRQAGAEVVHSHGHFAGVLGRLAALWARVPVAIHHLHTLDTTLRARHRGLERALAPLTDRFVGCSDAVARHAARLGVPRRRLVTILNGIDPPPAARREEARALLGDPPAPVIGCVGSLTAHKGQSVLLAACALLPWSSFPGTLVFVGDGPERAALESAARRDAPPGRVRFLGEVPDARRLVPGFDLCVVPSVAREGLSLALLEAMDAARPAIASRVGGMPEVVEDGVSGLLVPAADPPALAEAIKRVLARPDGGAALGAAAARRVAARFRAGPMTRQVETLYEEVLDDRRAA